MTYPMSKPTGSTAGQSNGLEPVEDEPGDWYPERSDDDSDAEWDGDWANGAIWTPDGAE